MKNKTYSFTYSEFEQENELSVEDQKLLAMAKESAKTSYAPYSGYHVGAALRLDNGEIIKGSNQENVAYPNGLCAERVAAFYASSNYPGIAFETIAVTAQSDDFEINDPVTPCGSCRQVLSEYENKAEKPIRIIMQGASGKIILVNSVQNLLPFTFNESKLKNL
ncbi:MAG: cytidine deaminase [Bacteroidales bacterium]|nr:cytidine deaminase [Bacteroidales bacterium]MCF8327222.1 cytidine deaminase [Bacteroidales bacterium]